MAVKDFFKRVIVNVRERPNSGDLNRMQNRVLEACKYLAASVFGESFGSSSTPLWSQRTTAMPPNGFLGDSFKVSVNSGAAPYGLKIEAGVGYSTPWQASTIDFGGATGLDWDPDSWAPLVLSDTQVGIAVPSVPVAGHSRIDIIEVRNNYSGDDPTTVGIFNPTTEVFDPTVLNKSFEWDLRGLTGTVTSPATSTAAISYKVGVDYAGGIAGATEPSVTPGYMKIARINLDGAVAAITDDLIADLRRPVLPNAMLDLGGTIGIPGVVGGIGSEEVQQLDLPTGVIVRVAYNNATPPSAGYSYLARVFVIGGDITPRTQNIVSSVNVRGSAVASPVSEFAPRCITTGTPAVARVTAAVASILAGTDASYTVMNGNITVPLGTPYATFTVGIIEPTGAALSNVEYFTFHYKLSLA